MADVSDTIHLKPGSLYVKGVQNFRDESAVVTDFRDGGVDTVASMIGAATVSDLQIGQAPLRTIEVERLGGGKARVTGRYGRSGGGSLQRKVSFGTGTGNVRWHVLSDGTNVSNANSIAIQTTIISATVHTNQTRTPYNTQLVDNLGTINSQAVIIPGLGSVAAGHVRFKGISGDYIESPQRWQMGVVFEIQWFYAMSPGTKKAKSVGKRYGWKHTEVVPDVSPAVAKVYSDWPTTAWGPLNL